MDFVAYHSSAEWWYLEALLSAIQRLKCGTTQALYMLGNAPRGDTADVPLANARGVREVGVRSILAFGPSRPPWPREYTYWKDGRRIERLVSIEETFEVTDDTIGRWNSAHVGGPREDVGCGFAHSQRELCRSGLRPARTPADSPAGGRHPPHHGQA